MRLWRGRAQSRAHQHLILKATQPLHKLVIVRLPTSHERGCVIWAWWHEAGVRAACKRGKRRGQEADVSGGFHKTGERTTKSYILPRKNSMHQMRSSSRSVLGGSSSRWQLVTSCNISSSTPPASSRRILRFATLAKRSRSCGMAKEGLDASAEEACVGEVCVCACCARARVCACACVRACVCVCVCVREWW